MRHNTINIADGEIATLEFGCAETAHTTLVFVHGWLDNAASFSSILPMLANLDQGLHLCAIDLPGHGFSSHKGAGNFYPFHDYIDDLHQILTTLSSNRLVLVGHSLGALIASCYSAAFPEHVAGLVQIEGFGPLAESADKSVERLRQGVLSRQRLRRKPKRTTSNLEEMTMRRATLNGLDSRLIRPVVERGMICHQGVWHWRHDSRLQSDSLYRMSLEHAAAVIQKIHCPQLVILGDQGYAHLKDFPRISNLLDDVEAMTEVSVEIIDGAHHCHLQSPSSVTALIFGLLNKI
ncbi:alpha/beta fold hydrolase [Vibrio genomosp. F10]|uniref:alpha/beta fold hydrolase n=1 Tax=Vibrio genomosp. F10 TaxID=723171 RepID=UPI0002EE2B58|nr:alpha/beta hydrolase [Vibrio genomosp. F10]OEF09745.1 hydrolase [Vibrio genomosp. F10 str. 9ZD137]